MLIGVISDSHDNLSNLTKALKLLLEKRVEAIIHLGDIISPFVVKHIRKLLEGVEVKLIAILGNNDGDTLSLFKLFNEYSWSLYQSPSVVEVDGKVLYLMHGFGSIDFTEKLVYSVFKQLDVDVVLYGHTHVPRFERVGGRVLLNPGEVCGYLTGKPSVAIMDTKDLSVEFIYL